MDFQQQLYDQLEVWSRIGYTSKGAWTALLLLAVAIASKLTSKRKAAPAQSAKSSFYKTKDYVAPVIKPEKDFVWDQTPPLKSLPFKNAEYKLTMGIRNLDAQDWLLVEPNYLITTREKKRIITNTHPEYPEKDTRGSTLFVTPEAIPAIREFYSIAVNYMCDKYPTCFTRQGKTVHNLISDQTIPLAMPATDDVRVAETYIEYLCDTIQEDFIILLKDPSREDEKDGTEYFFKGGLFGFAAGFDPKHRFNTPLSFVHHPVPGYEEKLKLSMNRFFNRIQPGQFVTRGNFSVQTHNKYFVDDSNKGHNLPKDTVQQPLDFASLDFDRQVHYRSERQVLTRLPQSGAVVFTIRTYLHPMSQIKNEGREVCERLAGAVRGLPPDIAYYKRAGEWGPPLIQYLLDT